jgi:hypothetical protein
VATVALVKELMAGVLQALALVVECRRHDEAGLEEGLRLSIVNSAILSGRSTETLPFGYRY